MILSDFPYSYPHKTNFNKFCTNCGTQNNNYKYCPNCGTAHITDYYPTWHIWKIQDSLIWEQINKPIRRIKA